jgi:hypothetical protein
MSFSVAASYCRSTVCWSKPLTSGASLSVVRLLNTFVEGITKELDSQ